MTNDVAIRRRHVAIVKSETRDVCNDVRVTEDMILSVKEEILDSRKKLKNLEVRTRLNDAELQRWASVNKDRLADEEYMHDFARKDTAKFKVLQAELGNVTASRLKTESQLSEIVSENMSLRVELESVLKAVEVHSDERHSLIAQFESATGRVREADSELQSLSERFLESVTILNEKQRAVKNLGSELASIEKENRSRETQLDLAESELGRLRQEAHAFESEVKEFQGELDSCQSELRAATAEEGQVRAQVDSCIKSVELAKVRLSEIVKKIAIESERNSLVLEGRESRERQVDEATKVLQDTVLVVAEWERQIKDAKDKLFFESNRLDHFKQLEKVKMVELSRLAAVLKQLPARLEAVSSLKMAMTEKIFGVEFDIDRSAKELESLVGHVSSGQERDDLLRKLSDLEKQWKETNAVHSLLQTQVKRQETDRKRCQKCVEELKNEQKSVEEIVTETGAEIDSIQKTIAQAQGEKTELLKTRDEVVADISAKRDVFRERIVQLKSAQDRHMQAVESADKLSNDASLNTVQLQALNKQLHEQRHVVAVKVGESQHRLSQIRIKFDHLFRRRVGAGEDDIHSQASAVVRAARKREELISLGDQLDKELRDKLSEIKALEAAAAYWKEGNSELSNSVDPTNSQLLQRERLLRTKSRRLEFELSKLNSEQNTLMNLESRRAWLIRSRSEEENEICQLFASSSILSAVFAHTLKEAGLAARLKNEAYFVVPDSLKDLKRSCTKFARACPFLFEKLRQNLIIKGIEL